MNKLIWWVFFIYFFTHIPITLLVDLQAIFDEQYPQPLRDLNSWYINTYNDRIMLTKPVWLKSFIYCELFFQIPIFFYAVFCLLKKSNKIRIPGILYGAHVSTTVIPILAELYFGAESHLISLDQKIVLSGFYFPYLLIPLWFAIYLSIYDKPFGEKIKQV